MKKLNFNLIKTDFSKIATKHKKSLYSKANSRKNSSCALNSSASYRTAVKDKDDNAPPKVLFDHDGSSIKKKE